MLLKFKPFCAPLNYRFRDPNTGFKFEAASEKELVSRIRSYRQQNNLEPLEFLEAVIENYLCHRPENVGGCTQRGEFKRGVFAYLKGGLVLLKNLAYKSYVSQEVADKRAALCLQCPKNVFPDKDRFIKWSDSVAEASVGDRKAKGHELLGNCDVCSCVNKAKVWYPGPFTPTKEELAQFPDFCWQKQVSKK